MVEYLCSSKCKFAVDGNWKTCLDIPVFNWITGRQQLLSTLK